MPQLEISLQSVHLNKDRMLCGKIVLEILYPIPWEHKDIIDHCEGELMPLVVDTLFYVNDSIPVESHYQYFKYPNHCNKVAYSLDEMYRFIVPVTHKRGSLDIYFGLKRYKKLLKVYRLGKVSHTSLPC